MANDTADDDRVSEADQVTRERDLYRKLLDLGAQDELEPLLAEALELIVTMASARRGYLEIQDERSTSEAPRFWIAHGFTESDVAEIRGSFSLGVIAEAIATRKTIATASALTDQRFRDRRSVRRNLIEEVLCAPIGADPPFGVLYLQGRVTPGPFTDDDQRRTEIFARQVAALTDRLLIRRRRLDETDPTQPVRAILRAEGVIGRSTALAQVLREVSTIARLDVTVLLTGASGTGKTQCARLIHDNGPRAEGPFIELNCAALPDTLLESELFGAVSGADSTATRKALGRIAAAEHGTLFLDEVGELSPAAQSKLLKVIELREYFPLGSSRSQKADVRLIAATNVDLRAAVSRREFREDLLYRLEVLPIRIPSLAERREDIPDLVAYFCASAVVAHRLPHLRVSPGALRAAEEAEWPGNVRQLANAVTAAALRAAGEALLQVERRHLFPGGSLIPAAKGSSPEAAEPDGRADPAAPEKRFTFQEATRRFQQGLLKDTLDAASWNVTETANRLDLTRAHVYNLIRAFGFERTR